ncbi:MAG: hypothetical protein QME59_01825 [Candidatus Hydrothermarchaeota archaeon]|nr:hypothetical protein [Candidatus Hydrothermarchaeota archaeon]
MELSLDKDGNIVAVEIGKKKHQLKKPLSFKEGQELIKAINVVENYIDFEGSAATPDDLGKLCVDLSLKQRKYLNAIINEPKTTEELEGILGLNSRREIAGIRQGLTRRAKKLGIKTVDVIKLSPENGTYRYTVRKSYGDALITALKER